MNKVILMGRLVRDAEIKYGQGEQPVAVARYTLAVDRKYKKTGEAEADFLNCVAFGKNAEFAKNYLKKGLLVCICGRIQTRSYFDTTGQKKWTTEVIVDEQNFAESKKSFEARNTTPEITEDDDLPF